MKLRFQYFGWSLRQARTRSTSSAPPHNFQSLGFASHRLWLKSLLALRQRGRVQKRWRWWLRGSVVNHFLQQRHLRRWCFCFIQNTTTGHYAGRTKKLNASVRHKKSGTELLVGFRIRTPSVPRASIIWLAPAVKDTTKNGSNKSLAVFRSSLTAFAPPKDGT